LEIERLVAIGNYSIPGLGVEAGNRPSESGNSRIDNPQQSVNSQLPIPNQ
jgi:hypothetical protein